MTSVVPDRIVPAPRRRDELHLWVTALIATSIWFQVLAETTRRHAAGTVWMATGAGLAAQLGFTAFEAAVTATVWRALGVAASWRRLAPRLLVASAAEAVAIDIAAGHTVLPPSLALALAGPRAAGVAPTTSLPAAFAAVGALTLVRIVASAGFQARAVGAPFVRALGVVLALWLVSRLALWWGFDLLQGRSFQP